MAFGGGFDDEEVMSEINMTPLVDVMLVLLIIFIITVPVITHSVKVDLPQASNQRNEITPDTINIAVLANGELHWNEDTVSNDDLQRRLAEAAQKDPQPQVHLRGDKSVAYEHVVTTMAAIQRSGIEKLGFVTEPGP
ncbi:ExbD/TolR family protein [Marinimicrobium sp. ARAG 43.8]|uniref:ExbD/TolR family protein n=1 Tax=Marinimicrobium sp. ARAG 43.8 TaxID=3418719 RepID=UPI003CE975E3